MTEGRLNADVDAYLQAAAMNLPPPSITSDPLVAGGTPIEELLRVLVLATNADDPEDYAESLDEHASRDAQVTEAAEKFGDQDQGAAAELTQQLPQWASGVAGTLAGGMGGIVGPLTQIPQAFGQAAAQALQSGLSAFGPSLTGSGLGLGPDMNALGSEPDDVESADAGDGGWDNSDDRGIPADTGITDRDLPLPAGFGGPPDEARLNGSAQTAAPGPPPVSPAATARAPSPPAPAPVSGGAPASPGSALAGMPVAPPTGVGPAQGKETKPETKRVSAPIVRNGAPVQGRIAAGPGPDAIDDPTIVVTRRLSSPDWS